MAWTLDGIRIFVQDDPETYKQIIARLQPLNSGTVHHFFGYESPIIKISAIVVGTEDKDAIEAMTTTGDYYTLIGPEGSLGTYYVAAVTAKQRMVIWQSIRTDLECTAPVYDIEIDLYQR